MNYRPLARLLFVLVMLVSIFLTVACGGSRGPAPTPLPSATPTSELPPHKIGEAVEAENQVVTLNSVGFEGTILKANFSLENKGANEITVSVLLAFSAQDSQGKKLGVAYCGGSALDNRVKPGEIKSLDLCWSGGEPGADIMLFYEPALFKSNPISWLIK